jgi:hypothetical protein
MIARRKRLVDVRTRQHERAHAVVAAAELARDAAVHAHEEAKIAVAQLLVQSWETGALERATAAIDARRVQAQACADEVVRAADVRRAAAFARRRADQALQAARAERAAAALKREQTEHDERAARRRR